MKNHYEELIAAIELMDISSPYIDTLKQLNLNILYSNKQYIDVLNDMRICDYTKWNGTIINEFKDIDFLYKAIINQKIISDEELKQNYCLYDAFLFLLYRTIRIEDFNNVIKEFEKYGLSTESSTEQIVQTLYEYDIELDKITNYLNMLEHHKNNFTSLLCIDDRTKEHEVKKIIDSLKEKRKIQSLLNANNQSKAQTTIADVDLMDGAQFEACITNLFNKLGYKAENTKLSGDQGIDVVAIKGNTKVAIQCKCFTGSVGNHAVMEAFAGAKYYNADKCMVVTNSTFTKSARALAEKNGVVLWDRQVLIEKLKEI